jgi:SAM-dependent methyltransferase
MSSNIGAGGYHWQRQEHVERWNAAQRAQTLDRTDAFAEMLDYFPSDTRLPLRVVDLGAGDGMVTSVVLQRFPEAQAILIDFSPPMMEKGAERLAPFAGRYAYVTWDMNIGDWPADRSGPFDAVVSSAAIHHLQNDRKQWLFKVVLERLVPGGVFANYDLFRDPLAAFSDEEVHGRTCATIHEARSFLVNAGFGNLVVTARSARPKHKGELALLVGTRPRLKP